MLVVIAGATGNLGHHLCRSALRRGHAVRGLGRNPEKLEAALRERLESFVVSSGHLDKSAYDKACEGADAVIVAFSSNPILVLDAQMLLLRAAESAGVKRFHGLSWNCDWSKRPLGDLISYDPMIAFATHAFQTSSIHPCYSFIGVLSNTYFAVPGAGRLEDDQAMWARHGDPKENRRTIRYVGSPDAKMNFTSEEDAADFTVALITSECGEKGGFYHFCSDVVTPNQVKETFERVRGGEVELVQVMDLDTAQNFMHKTKADAKAAGPGAYQAQWWTIVGLEYAYWIPSGRIYFDPVDADKFSDVSRTTLAKYIEDHDYV
ncbi:NAD(P)-binding protein [Thozetella sp. PMI_491]|nr:NAD(P)-binding protein [Thozetella sp. PMI_491]